MKNKLKVAAMLLAAGAFATPSWAALSINFNGTNNGTTVTGGTTCVDNAGCDTDATVGHIQTATTLGTLSITSTTGNSGSPTGSLSIDLHGTPSATGTFTLAISDNGFTSPPPTNIFLAANVSGNSSPDVGGTTGVAGNVSGIGFISGGNLVFATNGTSTGTFGPTAFKAGAAAGQAGPITTASPYSLTEFITINITALATTTDKAFQINGNVSTVAAAVPEPASVSLLGGVLLFAVAGIRRRMKRA